MLRRRDEDETEDPFTFLNEDHLPARATGMVRWPILSGPSAMLLAILVAALAVFSHTAVSPRRQSHARAELDGHTVRIRALAIAPDGQTLASCDENGSVIVWDAEHHPAHVFHNDRHRPIHGLAFSTDGVTLASGDVDGVIVLRNVRTGKTLTTWKTQSSSVVSLAFSPDGSMLATGCGDSAIRIWNLESSSVTTTLRGHRGAISSLCFSPDGRALASGCGIGLVKLWEIQDGQFRERRAAWFHANSVSTLAFSPDGTILASGGICDGVKLWDVATGRERSLAASANQYVRTLAFAAQGRILVAVRPNGISYLWNLSGNGPPTTIEGYSNLTCAAISNGGRMIATGGEDAFVRLWDLDKWIDTLDSTASSFVSYPPQRNGAPE